VVASQLVVGPVRSSMTTAAVLTRTPVNSAAYWADLYLADEVEAKLLLLPVAWRPQERPERSATS
jgi:hypothetical protein